MVGIMDLLLERCTKMTVDKNKSADKIDEVSLAIQLAIQKALKTVLSTSKINIDKDKASYTASYTASCTEEPRKDFSKEINKLVSKAAKFTSYNYVNAINQRKRDDQQFRLNRLLRKMRPHYSEDGYMDVVRAIQKASHFERLDFILKMERVYFKKHNRTS